MKIDIKNYDFDSATQEELIRDFSRKGKLNVSGLIRAIILKELEVCKSEVKETRMLRDFWYDCIKIPLSRAEGDRALEKKWGRKRSKTLSSVLSKMVLNRECRYSDLYMEDQSRQRNRLKDFERRVYNKIFVFVEKDSTYYKIKNVSEIYRIGLMSGKGFDATMAIEMLSKEMKQDEEYKFLMLTDYDFYGFDIVRDFNNRCMKLGLRVDVERIGINPNQMNKDEVKKKKYRLVLRTPRQRKWAKEYAIDGKFGLELQAISPRDIRTILVESLDELCPEEELYDYLKRMTLSQVPDEAVNELIEFYTETLKEIIEKEVNKICFKKSGEFRKGFDDRPDIPIGTLSESAINNEDFLGMENQSLINGVVRKIKRRVKDGKIKIKLK